MLLDGFDDAIGGEGHALQVESPLGRRKRTQIGRHITAYGIAERAIPTAGVGDYDHIAFATHGSRTILQGLASGGHQKEGQQQERGMPGD